MPKNWSPEVVEAHVSACGKSFLETREELGEPTLECAREFLRGWMTVYDQYDGRWRPDAELKETLRQRCAMAIALRTGFQPEALLAD